MTLTGKHQWSYRRRQLTGNNGERYYPWVKESYVQFVGCVCGVEATKEQEAEARKMWRETKQAAKWAGETGEQARLFDEA